MALAALVVCAALSACGGQDADDRTGTASPSEGSPVTSSPSTGPAQPVDPTAPMPTVPSTAVPPTKRPPAGPSLPPGPGATTITGTVQPGVEPNCLLVDGYQLIGGPRDVLAVGAKVTVTGQPKPDMMTTCQQGIPFVVEAAKRA
ncbi:hypothetical protein HDA35_002756 [Micromonospora purpureochromogenes]|uniref:Uncharacterized protein n=2 Tax=Micromonospora purpureochromogenes TaxID=47872 RepID=A0ABX2RK94_9ACTN|nr:hypothetical protein [Micromonospora purpureochromogenes]